MRQARSIAAVTLLALAGCGGAKVSQAEQERMEALKRAEAAHLDAVARYTERTNAGQEYRIDLALQKHASGEISDKDLIEIVGQVHKQALSRINADKAILMMEQERRDAASQLAEALKQKDTQKSRELQEKLNTLEHNYRMLQSELDSKRRELREGERPAADPGPGGPR